MEEKNINPSYYKNALTLSFLGDAVFTLKVREYLVKNSNNKLNMLNKTANSIVCATNQAQIMLGLKGDLDEDELDIVTRARNSHTNNKAKHSTLQEYNLATQFEALVGYWYLTGNTQKIDAMFKTWVEERL